MARVLDYLSASGCLATAPDTTITMPANGLAFNFVPSFAGTAEGVNPIDRVEVQIIDPAGLFWDGHNWVAWPQWLTANGTNSWDYSLSHSIQTQGDYRLWARAWDTDALSDTTPAFTSFIYDNVPPEVPTLLAPAQGITTSPVPTGYFWLEPSGDTGSPLAYNLQIDELVVTHSTTNFTAAVWLPKGWHNWRVRAYDAAGNRSLWTDFWSFWVDHYDHLLPVFIQD
jgi:hypothetical protein